MQIRALRGSFSFIGLLMFSFLVTIFVTCTFMHKKRSIKNLQCFNIDACFGRYAAISLKKFLVVA